MSKLVGQGRMKARVQKVNRWRIVTLVPQKGDRDEAKGATRSKDIDTDTIACHTFNLSLRN